MKKNLICYLDQNKTTKSVMKLIAVLFLLSIPYIYADIVERKEHVVSNYETCIDICISAYGDLSILQLGDPFYVGKRINPKYTEPCQRQCYIYSHSTNKKNNTVSTHCNIPDPGCWTTCFNKSCNHNVVCDYCQRSDWWDACVCRE